MSPAVSVASLVKSFGPNEVFSGASLSFPRGRFAALLGPNGSGKTTLLKILAGLAAAESGEVRVLGLDPERDRQAVASRIGWNPGDPRSLYARLSVRENLAFFAGLHGLAARTIGDRTEALASRFGMAGALDRPVQELASGFQKRALMMRALIHEPELLLLDEPMQGLDPVAAERLMEGRPAWRIEGDASVLMATHRLDDAVKYADEVWVVSRGLLVRAAGSRAECAALTRSDLMARLAEAGA